MLKGQTDHIVYIDDIDITLDKFSSVHNTIASTHERACDIFTTARLVEEQSRIIKKNMRAILQLFDIKVLVYPDRVEIKGTIPSQVLYQEAEPEPKTGLVITSLSLNKGGESYVREASPLFYSPLSYRFILHTVP